MQHVGAGRAGDVGPVVDREQGAVPPRRVGEDRARRQLVAGFERPEPLLADRTLVAQLHNVHPACQRGIGELGQIAVLTTRVGTQIQPRRREPGNTLVHTATLAR